LFCPHWVSPSKLTLHTPEFMHAPQRATRGADRGTIDALFDIVNAVSQVARNAMRAVRLHRCRTSQPLPSLYRMKARFHLLNETKVFIIKSLG